MHPITRIEMNQQLKRKKVEQTFGEVIRAARKEKGYSQRELAKQIGLDFTYLSKLENNRADYPPRENAIRIIAQKLNLNEEELVFLAGRIPQRDSELLKQHYLAMPALFSRMRDDETFVEKLLQALRENG